jgi:hypothetical protein
MQTGFIENIPIASFPCIRRSGVSLPTLIADTRKAVAGHPDNAQAAFSAHGTLVGVTEGDIRTGTHTFKLDEPPALGGADMAANPVQYALAALHQELAAAVDEHCPVLLVRNQVPVSRTFFSASGSLSVPGSYHTSPCLASSRMADQRVHPSVISWRPRWPVRPAHTSAPGGMPG